MEFGQFYLISGHHLSDPLLIIWEKEEYKIFVLVLVYLIGKAWELFYNSQAIPQFLKPPMWDFANMPKVNTFVQKKHYTGNTFKLILSDLPW